MDKMMKVNQSEIQALVDKKNQAEFEEESLFHIINDYIEDRGIREDFLLYLKGKRMEVGLNKRTQYGDIDKHIKDFE